ncbi:MAG: TatD family hydrolase [Acidimicrobiaceae bacterium]|nr:TatD family hydrolase [Acidimicrobiaceae bacterium]MCY4176564.1 TatD family hydrolase [Acidimicrobiaceae bacterium]MCY4279304.1 TatD family hydrolase [Acidimicrobiaceae bacterium]MCY4294698.1 TatD family hydrolase [Acidimicrobiaceae bacterium]
MAWADNHCHLPADGASEVVAEARDAGVELLINVATDVEDSRQAIAVARDHRGVWATAGVHPHEASQGIAGLEGLLEQPGVVAVGEAGLDYFYDHSPRPVQREVFAEQIGLANRYDLPLVVHSRAAWDDTFAVLDSEGMPSRTVMHCFTGGPHQAEECLRRGAMLSFSGIITFPKAPEVRDSARLCPLDRLMVETDSPYLAPVPHRGKANRPAWVSVVGAAVADAKSLDVRDVQRATLAATRAFYLRDAARETNPAVES